MFLVLPGFSKLELVFDKARKAEKSPDNQKEKEVQVHVQLMAVDSFGNL